MAHADDCLRYVPKRPAASRDDAWKRVHKLHGIPLKTRRTKGQQESGTGHEAVSDPNKVTTRTTNERATLVHEDIANLYDYSSRNMAPDVT